MSPPQGARHAEEEAAKAAKAAGWLAARCKSQEAADARAKEERIQAILADTKDPLCTELDGLYRAHKSRFNLNDKQIAAYICKIRNSSSETQIRNLLSQIRRKVGAHA